MGISDSQFNMYYSIKSFSSMFPPFVIALAVHSVGLKPLLLVLSSVCAIGQFLFVYGLKYKDHSLCLAGRFFIGLSDS